MTKVEAVELRAIVLGPGPAAEREGVWGEKIAAIVTVWGQLLIKLLVLGENSVGEFWGEGKKATR